MGCPEVISLSEVRARKQWDTLRHQGFVNLLRLISSQDKQGRYPGHPCLLGSPLRARHLSPTRKSVPHFLAILRRRQQMTSRSEVLGDGVIRGQKALGMPCRCKPLHATLPLARWPMRVLTPIIERAALTMFDPGQDLPLGRAVALELIGDDDAWHVLQPLE